MILDQFKLDGKTALITGCNRGIGKTFAISLAEAGAEIIGVSYSGKFEETKNSIENIGMNFTGYQADFSNRNSLYKFIRQVKQDFSNIDILINNAGTIMRNPIEVHSDDSWDNVIEVNLSAQFILSREIGEKMLSRGFGKIIFTASLLSFQGGITVPGYAASKAGIKQLTMSFANEWASKGINVNAIAPGYIATDNTIVIRENENRNKAILDRIPQGRWGEPDDLAGAVVFLSSEASNYLNGTVITVDGGWMGR